MPVTVLRSRPRSTAARPAVPRLLRVPRISPRALVVILLVLALLGGGWLLVRDSSLVGVRKVTVTGATGVQAGKLRSALTQAALGMTTLHVSESTLLDVARDFPGVRSISVQTHFPHGLTIHVDQLLPVGVLATGGGRRTLVAADGTLLPDALSGPLGTISAPGASRGGRLTSGIAQGELRILGAAPVELRGRIARAAHDSSHGFVIRFRRGPLAWFGGAGALADKWAALARVLAYPTVGGATYIDVTVPRHPVVGGLSGGPGPQSDVPDASADTPAGRAPAGQNGAPVTPLG